MNLCTLVDRNDNVISYKERSQLEPGDIYRITSLWVANSKDEVLLAQRVLTKKNDPGKWGPAVAGTVENKESYDESIAKEAREELGITGVSFVMGPKLFLENNSYGMGHYCQTYIVKLDWPIEKFKPQVDEVAAIIWISVSELQYQVSADPEQFTAGFAASSAQLFAYLEETKTLQGQPKRASSDRTA